MTEAQWLSAVDPTEMLNYLYDKVSDRKWRLFAVACCRRVEHHLRDWRAEHALTVAEQYAEGLATAEQLLQANQQVADAVTTIVATLRSGADVRYSAMNAVRWVSLPTQPFANAARACASSTASAIRGSNEPGVPNVLERQAQASLLRCLFGNPFRPLQADAAWLTWHGGTVAHLAQVIYKERRFVDLPILADALEEAGCTDADLLAHCRSRGEHAHGCWAVDLLLGHK